MPPTTASTLLGESLRVAAKLGLVADVETATVPGFEEIVLPFGGNTNVNSGGGPGGMQVANDGLNVEDLGDEHPSVKYNAIARPARTPPLTVIRLMIGSSFQIQNRHAMPNPRLNPAADILFAPPAEARLGSRSSRKPRSLARSARLKTGHCRRGVTSCRPNQGACRGGGREDRSAFDSRRGTRDRSQQR